MIKTSESLIKEVAKDEGVAVDFIKKGVESGTIVIPYNLKRRKKIKAIGIGKGLRTKVNANIGSSPVIVDIEMELKKLENAISAGADTVMDLSIGGDIDEIRRKILENSTIPVGTVPIYQAALDSPKFHKSFVELSVDEIFKIFEKHLMDGIDFITVHTGITREGVEKLRKQKRLTGVVSRGGNLIIEWMEYNRKENPLYEHFSDLLDMAKEFGITLSLGDGLRPGSLHDATDSPQIHELIVIGTQVLKAREKGVQTMVEGPGHIPIQEIEVNVALEKKLCHGAPFYVLGPVVTDVAPGYDHIVSAIGGAIAAQYGADFLCYVTPVEHIGLPTPENVTEGVIATKIAAHVGDIAKGKKFIEWDEEISKLRSKFKWEDIFKKSIAPKEAMNKFKNYPKVESEVCTMCGEFCPLRRSKKYLRNNLFP